MGDTEVVSVDPGAGPIPVGVDEHGIYEYVIEASIIWQKGV